MSDPIPGPRLDSVLKEVTYDEGKITSLVLANEADGEQWRIEGEMEVIDPYSSGEPVPDGGVPGEVEYAESAAPQQPTTAITLFEREDGRRSIAYGAHKDMTVLAEDGTRQHNRAVEVVWLSGDLSFEAIRQAYANAESILGTASGWLGGES